MPAGILIAAVAVVGLPYFWLRRRRRRKRRQHYGEIEIRIDVPMFRDWLKSKGIEPFGPNPMLATEGAHASVRLRTLNGVVWLYQCTNRLFIDSGQMGDIRSPRRHDNVNLYVTQERNGDLLVNVVSVFGHDGDQRVTPFARIPFVDFYEYKIDYEEDIPFLSNGDKELQELRAWEAKAREALERANPGRVRYGERLSEGFSIDFMHVQYTKVLTYYPQG